MAVQRLWRVLLTVALVGGGLTVISGGPAVAECTRLDPWPSFSQAVPSAETVFVGTVTDTPELGFPNSRFTLRVDEVLRGDPPAVIDFYGFKSGVPLTICPGDSVLRVRKNGERLAFAMDARMPGVYERIDAVAFVDDSKPSRFMLPKMEQLPLTKVRRLAGHAADGSTVGPPPYTPIGWPPEGLVTVQVEPGVLRVITDGHRVLSDDRQDDDVFAWGEWQGTHLERQVVTAPDGAVWVFDDTGMSEVGNKKTRNLKGEPPVRSIDDVEVAPDNTIWRVGTPKAGLATLHALSGKKWRRDYLPGMSVFGVEVQPDGTVWALWVPPVGADPQGLAPKKLGKWNGEKWTVYDLPKMRASYGGQFAVTGKNDVWLCCKEKPWTEQQRLLHFNGHRFDVVDDPAPQTDRIMSPLLIDGSPDGTLWMRRSETTLARHDDEGWTVYTADDGVPQMGWMPEDTGGFLRAAPDGSVWVSTTLDRGGEAPDDWPPACDGVGHFDGTTWTQYLEGMCVFALDVARDGRAWVQGALPDIATTSEPVPGEPIEPIQTFVIDPAGAAATTDMDEAQPSPSGTQ